MQTHYTIRITKTDCGRYGIHYIAYDGKGRRLNIETTKEAMLVAIANFICITTEHERIY